MKYLWILVFLGLIFGVSEAEYRSTTVTKGSGIIFIKTTKLEEVKQFYIERVGCELWLDQGNCAILKYGNILVGFCENQKADLDALVTFFYENKEHVDEMYKGLESISASPPKENTKYRIYHFYARDPEGRSVEFQSFLHPIEWDFKAYQED